MIIFMSNILSITDLSLCSYRRLRTNYCPQLSNKLILVGLCSFVRHLFNHLHHIGRNPSYCMDRRLSNLYHVWWNPCNFCRSSQCHWWPEQCLVSHVYFSDQIIGDPQSRLFWYLGRSISISNSELDFF